MSASVLIHRVIWAFEDKNGLPRGSVLLACPQTGEYTTQDGKVHIGEPL